MAILILLQLLHPLPYVNHATQLVLLVTSMLHTACLAQLLPNDSLFLIVVLVLLDMSMSQVHVFLAIILALLVLVF
jgi:hypothetical protein